MTLTRRQTLVGAAATVAAAALPAVKAEVVHYTDMFGHEWAGDAEYIEVVRMFDQRDIMHETDLGWVRMSARGMLTDADLEDISGDRDVSLCHDCPKLDTKWAAENGVELRLQCCCDAPRNTGAEIYRIQVGPGPAPNRAQRRQMERNRRWDDEPAIEVAES
jgi:hypothetical protein